MFDVGWWVGWLMLVEVGWWRWLVDGGVDDVWGPMVLKE